MQREYGNSQTSPRFDHDTAAGGNVELLNLVAASPSKLLDDLASTVQELCAVMDEIAMTRAAELQTQNLAWNGQPDDNIQKKDRHAKYATTHLTIEVIKLEATRDALTERKYFIIRLLDRHHHGNS